jgi:hypothetical protein
MILYVFPLFLSVIGIDLVCRDLRGFKSRTHFRRLWLFLLNFLRFRILYFFRIKLFSRQSTKQVNGLNTSSSQTFPKILPKGTQPAAHILGSNENSVDSLKLENRITLVTKLATSEEGLAATNKLLEQVIFLVDTFGKHKFRPEVMSYHVWN